MSSPHENARWNGIFSIVPGGLVYGFVASIKVNLSRRVITTFETPPEVVMSWSYPRFGELFKRTNISEISVLDLIFEKGSI